MENADKKFLAKTFQEEEVKRRCCIYPWCQEKAINSHVFQQNGILSDMSIKGHLMVLESPDIWKINFETSEISDISLHVKKRWIKDAYSFPWFCNTHDTWIFFPIEHDIYQVDFHEYKNQLLFSYRWLCNELHRKIVAHAFQSRVFDKLLDNEDYDRAEYLSYSKDWMKAWIGSLEKFKVMMESEIFNTDNEYQFTFQTFTFPRFDVWISVALSVLLKNYTDADGIRDYKQWLQLPNQFINIFPLLDKSIVIIGEHKDFHSDFFDFLIKKFSKCSSLEEYQSILSDLITARLEFWCMSPVLFSTLNQKKLNEYIKFYDKNINSHELDLHSWINIFN
mgnify:CR=1 FL=1